MQYGDFAAVYDALMADVDYDAWAAYLAEFLPAGAAVAECGCGTGSITVRLARQFNVTGLDISPAMLEVAAQKAREAGLRVQFVCQDMQKLALHRPVDAVVCACDGVNYLTSKEGAARFFAAAFAALKPGGLLLFDVSSRYKLQNVLGCNTFGQDDGELALLWRNMHDERSRLTEMELSFFVRRGELFERFFERHVQRAHSQAELESALCAAGFSEVAAYGALTREPPQKNTERIQFFARRPA